MSSPRKLQRLTSGVPGLDTVLGGGFFETGVYIFEGAPGAGKTILANQICFHLAASGRRSVYYTLLTESHDRMMRFLQELRFFDSALVPESITYVSGFKVLESEGLAGVLRNVRDTVQGRKPALLVVDGLVSAAEMAANDVAFKKFIHELQSITSMFRCTVILLTNIEAPSRLQAEHTMVDGILRLSAEVVGLKPQRSIDVVKFRGGAQLRGTHTLAISDAGIVVSPRIEVLLAPVRKRISRESARRPFDVSGLDESLAGGLPAVSVTMLLGASGTGKTSLGLHFVAAGIRAGEKALYFTFYEQPSELLEKAGRFGLELAPAFERGDLCIVWQSSVEARLDHIGERLVTAFNQMRPARVFIDGIQGFQVTADPAARMHDFFAALSDYFVAEGATVVFSAETEDILGNPVLRAPFSNASRMCQNILLLRFAEIEGRLLKVFSVLKLRDSGFDSSLRELRFTDRGAELGEQITNANASLGGHPLSAPGTAPKSR